LINSFNLLKKGEKRTWVMIKHQIKTGDTRMKKSEKKPGKLKIGISGSYGGYNLGDEAILQSICVWS
jgi:hypothetical protein